MPGENGNGKSEGRMIKLSVYLYRDCARAKQEGVIWLSTPKNRNKELHFNYLDQIPERIRKHLEMVGLTYDVAENSDNTVITPKTTKSKVVQKIRLKDI